jgi:hypothetical protein
MFRGLRDDSAAALRPYEDRAAIGGLLVVNDAGARSSGVVDAQRPTRRAAAAI